MTRLSVCSLLSITLLSCQQSGTPLSATSAPQSGPRLSDLVLEVAADSAQAPAVSVSQPEPAQAPPTPSTLTMPEVAPPSQPLPRSETPLFNPFPGGIVGGYKGDTGLDIGGKMIGVYALADGTLDYSEAGHTRWTGKRDSPYTVRLALDHPIAYKGRRITHVYYGHLSVLDVNQPEGAPVRYHVKGGQRLGISGMARGVPHLHLGLLLDGDVSQTTWDNILTESQVRQVLGGYRNGEKI